MKIKWYTEFFLSIKIKIENKFVAAAEKTAVSRGKLDRGTHLDHWHLSLKVQNIEFEIDVSFSTFLYPRSTIHQNLTSYTHLHAIIRPH